MLSPTRYRTLIAICLAVAVPPILAGCSSGAESPSAPGGD